MVTDHLAALQPMAQHPTAETLITIPYLVAPVVRRMEVLAATALNSTALMVAVVAAVAPSAQISIRSPDLAAITVVVAVEPLPTPVLHRRQQVAQGFRVSSW
jgi:hypothetical protein